MGEIEKIKRYVERAEKEIPDKIQHRYSMGCVEWTATAWGLEPLDAVALAFKFGMTKGYRAGRKSMEAQV